VTDYLASLIRTYIPVAIGAIAAWLTTRGIRLDHATTTALATGLTGAFTAIYYGAVRAAEHRWPSLGRLLGIARKPAYRADSPSGRDETAILP
jgi:hypothetical protein